MAGEPLPPTPKEKPFRKALTVLHDMVLAKWAFLRPFEVSLREAWSQMKQGLILFLILIAAPLVFVTTCGVRHVYIRKAESTMAATNSFRDSEKSGLSTTIQTQNTTISDLKHDKDGLLRQSDKFEEKAQNAENALAPWKQLANSQFTNAPFNQRLDLLFEHVAALEVIRPRFDVNLNGRSLKDGTAVVLSNTRSMQIDVVNTGEETAFDVTIVLFLPIASTNAECSGWEKASGMVYNKNRQELKGWSSWRIISQNDLSADDSFGTPSFTISTNLPAQIIGLSTTNIFQGSLVQTMPAEISVFSRNSKRTLILFSLSYPMP